MIVLFCCVWGWSDTTEEPVTLKLFSMPDPKNSDPFIQADLAVVRAFQDKYPYIKLKPFSGINIQGLGGDDSMLLAIAGGT